jgi:hypothetical protein
MTRTFRYALLAADDARPPDLKEYAGRQNEFKGRLIDDNVLHQLQRMYAFLELSERQDYNPYMFCFSYTDVFGERVNV